MAVAFTNEPGLDAPEGSGSAPPLGSPILANRATAELRLHPALAELSLHLPGDAAEGSGEAGSASLPLVVTASGIIIDGLDRWKRAVDTAVPSTACLVYDVPDHVALAMLIRASLRRLQLPPFCRVELALRINRRGGAETFKDWPATHSSNLTRSRGRDRRREIAELAGVSAGNVTKVSQILASAAPEVVQALRHGSISIHRAWLMRELPHRRQREELKARQQRMTIDRKVDQLIRRQLDDGSASNVEAEERRRILQGIAVGLPDDTPVVVIDAPGMVLAVSHGLLARLDARRTTP